MNFVEDWRQAWQEDPLSDIIPEPQRWSHDRDIGVGSSTAAGSAANRDRLIQSSWLCSRKSRAHVKRQPH